MEFKKASKYDIRIKHTANDGMIVKAGCCEVCFSGYKMMLEALAEYYENPENFEKRYNEIVGQDMPQPVDDCQEDCCESAPMGNTLAAGSGRALRGPSMVEHGPDSRR